jgi:hypothetical protein
MFGFFKRLAEVERKLMVYNKNIDYLYGKVEALEDKVFPLKPVKGIVEISTILSSGEILHPGKIIPVKSGTMAPVRIPIKNKKVKIDYNARPPQSVFNQVKASSKNRKPKTNRSKKPVPTLKTKNR